MRTTRILVIDDDNTIVKFLRANLRAEKYEVLTAASGEQALECIEKELPDLLLLDLMLPGMDGFDVLRRLREWSQTPVLVVSARGDDADKVRCLEMGADDYITKPFGVGELLARVKAVFRRTRQDAALIPPASFASGCIRINFAQRQVLVNSSEVKLTPTEYQLLLELVLNIGKVLTHAQLLNKVWGPEYRDEREYLHVFTRRLRAKLEPDPANPRYILTVPAVGYLFKGNG